MGLSYRDRLQLHIAGPPTTYVIKPAASSPDHRFNGRASVTIDAWPVSHLVGRWVVANGGWSVELSVSVENCSSSSVTKLGPTDITSVGLID